MMDKLSGQLSALSDKAKKTEDTVDAARANNRTKLEAKRDALKTSATSAAGAAKAGAATAKGKAGSKAAAARAALDARFAEIGDHAQERRAERDVKKANHHADVAEADASNAIDLALYVLDQAEDAIIDAVIARADADAMTPARHN